MVSDVMLRAVVKIPTVEEFKNSLTGLDRLLTARQWERAAIVWAFTTSDDPGGRPSKTVRKSGQFPVPIREFARLGFAGLSDKDTVLGYRAAWQSAIDRGNAKEVSPGDEVELPDLVWPPHDTKPETSSVIERSAPRTPGAERPPPREAARESPKETHRSPEEPPSREYEVEVGKPVCYPYVFRDDQVKAVSDWGFAGSALIPGLSVDERNYMIEVIVKLEGELKKVPIQVQESTT